MRYAFENRRRKAVREAAARVTPPADKVLDRVEEKEYSVIFHMKDGTTYTVISDGYDGEVACTPEHPDV